MLVTLSGIVTEVRLEHSRNASLPMLVTLSGIVTEVRPLHPENALSPMLVTLSGIVTEVRPLHPLNAQYTNACPILRYGHMTIGIRRDSTSSIYLGDQHEEHDKAKDICINQGSHFIMFQCLPEQRLPQSI